MKRVAIYPSERDAISIRYLSQIPTWFREGRDTWYVRLVELVNTSVLCAAIGHDTPRGQECAQQLGIPFVLF